MGIYDHVEIEVKCPKCGKLVSEFQTKDGPRQFLYLRPGLPFDRPYMNNPNDYYHNREFCLVAYDYCECGREIVIRFPLIPVTCNKVLLGSKYELLEDPR